VCWVGRAEFAKLRGMQGKREANRSGALRGPYLEVQEDQAVEDECLAAVCKRDETKERSAKN
jgi:hypothetical protein